MIFAYPEHSAGIREKLTQGAPLVACLCTTRCHKCDDWWAVLLALSEEWSAACFVWLDVDENPDMVADIPGLDAYPFMLVRVKAGCVVHTVPQNRADLSKFLRPLLMSELLALAPSASAEGAVELAQEFAPEPSLYYFLSE